MNFFQKLIKCYKNSLRDTIKHDGFEHAGYISFLSMLSIFPFFIFFTAIVTKIGDKIIYKITGESLLVIFTLMIDDSEFSNFIGSLRPRIIEITSSPPQSFLSLAIVSVIWTASSLLEGLRTILNRAYRVMNPPSYVLRRMMSILQFLLMSFIIMILLFTMQFLPIISLGIIKIIENHHYFFVKDIMEIVILIHSKVSSILWIIITFTFLSYIYYLIPNKRQKFTHTFIGTFHTMALWLFFTKAFQYYLSVFQQINIVYGSIAGIIIALLYFYMCSIIFIFGAELNYWIQKNFLCENTTHH